MYKGFECILPLPHGRVAVGLDDFAEMGILVGEVVAKGMVGSVIETADVLLIHKLRYVQKCHYICLMRLVIEDINTEHYKWLTEMAKTLNFKVVDVEFSEDEEDAYLLQAMESVKNDPILSDEEVTDLRGWLKSHK